jgi:hypothetical protein
VIPGSCLPIGHNSTTPATKKKPGLLTRADGPGLWYVRNSATLFLGAPVAQKGRLVQCAGRILRPAWLRGET